MNPIVEVTNLTKTFPPSFSFPYPWSAKPDRAPIPALTDVSFSLAPGKLYCVLGLNGAGKTTLLRIISTLLLPDKGTVKVNGYTLGNRDTKIKSCLGLVLEEERSFYWRLSGRQNLEFFGALFGIEKQALRNRINELLGLFKIEDAETPFSSYSTGMRKRFALIRSLLHNPSLLLLDEPSQGLDYTSGITLWNFIAQELVKKQGKTVLFTTHRIEEAEQYAHEFIILHQGKICALGTLHALREKINSPRASLSEIFLQLIQREHT